MELNTIGYSMAYACWMRLTRPDVDPKDTYFIAWELMQTRQRIG
jgi:hypothetical protein